MIKIILLFCMSSYIFSDNIDFGRMKHMKKKQSSSVELTNFDDKTAASIASSESYETPELAKVLGKKIKQIMSSVKTTSTTSGSYTYQCSYKCRTNGSFVYDVTDKFNMSIKANKSYEAESKLEDIAKKHCRSMRGRNSGEQMWFTSKRCE